MRLLIFHRLIVLPLLDAEDGDDRFVIAQVLYGIMIEC
jgi:hypothetical protein